MFTTARILRMTHLSKANFDIKQAQAKWQKQWPSMFKLTSEDWQKFYCLVQFPYPSGKLHLGHARVYFISDTIAHFNRLRQRRVIHPIGWDSFGLPAQNAAITHKTNPLQWTEQNIQDMKAQLLQLGVSFDWDRELATHKPDYYKWTQAIFLKLYEAGLAYKKEAEVNWDPVDKTVLANEQVDANGNSWRSGAKVEKRTLSQWFFKITAFAKELQQDLELLPKWPERVKEMQAGWIGAKSGHNISFEIVQHEDKSKVGSKLQIFTTRVETIMGCTFMAVPVKQKSGKIVGYCKHPLKNEKIPIYEADFVIENFGTGAIMGVPAHNENDEIFAKKHSIPMTIVTQKHIVFGKEQLINSDQFSGLDLAQGKTKIVQILKRKGLCEPKLELHLRDWLVSRQRYWGAPIPMVYCKSCGVQPVPKYALPVLLPRSDLSEGNPLVTQSFRSTQCPKCFNAAERQADTLDTFVDSSWYYLRYLDPHNQIRPFEPQKCKAMPADVYIGGIEHAIMHLLYARFIYKFLHRQGFIQNHVFQEPFEQLIVQGLVKGKAVKLKSNGRYLTKEEAATYPKEELEEVFEKMSKSKFNGVNPTELVEKYGCDALRMAMMFSAPVENDLDFKEEEVQRMEAFLKKVIELKSTIFDKPQKQSKEELDLKSLSSFEIEILDKSIQLIKSMEVSLEKQYTLHVYTARVMEFFNLIKNSQKNQLNIELQKFLFRIFAVCMIPLAPHVSYEIIELLPQKYPEIIDYILRCKEKKITWPKTTALKQALLRDNKVEVFVSINNKFKQRIRLSSQILKTHDHNKLLTEITPLKNFESLKGKQVRKMIVQSTAKGYIVNILIQK